MNSKAFSYLVDKIIEKKVVVGTYRVIINGTYYDPEFGNAIRKLHEYIDRVGWNKLTNLKYDDISGNSTYENLSSTVGQEKKPEAKSDNQENKPNPETVDMIVIAAVLFVISAAVILTIKFKKKIS